MVAARAGKTSGTQQLTGRVYDNRAGSDVDGSEHTPHQAHTGGIRRGRSSRTSSRFALASEAVRLARSRYAGVNHTHLSELLREREGIDIGRDTLRKILANAGVSSPRRRRPPKHRVRRQRMPREGMLIQVDGSYHRWLGKDGPQFTLLLAVDDATGVVADALFCELENTHSYFSLLAAAAAYRSHCMRTGMPYSSTRHLQKLPLRPLSSVARWTSLAYS